MRKEISLFILISLAAMGAGPCDVLQTAEQPEVDGGPCGAEECIDLLTVEVIRADNQMFLPGEYEFAVYLMDESVVSISTSSR